MRGLQEGIELVLRIARAILIERSRLESLVRPHGTGPRTVLVDIVPEVGDQVTAFLGEVLVGGEEPLLIVLAGDHPEAERGHRPIGGSGPQPPHRAHRPA